MSCCIGRYNAGLVDPELARELSDDARVIALDPGDHGMTAARLSSGRIVFCSPLIWEDVVRLQLTGYSKVVLLAEDQFLKMNPATSKELTWQTASLSGFLAAMVKEEQIVHVMPRVWQAEQMRRMKVPARKQLNREDGIRLALDELREKVPAVYLASFSQALIEGCASALGILLWWEALCSR